MDNDKDKTMGGGAWALRECGNCREYNLGRCMVWNRFASARGRACNRWLPRDARTDEEKRRGDSSSECGVRNSE